MAIFAINLLDFRGISCEWSILAKLVRLSNLLFLKHLGPFFFLSTKKSVISAMKQISGLNFDRSGGLVGTICGGFFVSANVSWGQICNLGKWCGHDRLSNPRIRLENICQHYALTTSPLHTPLKTNGLSTEYGILWKVLLSPPQCHDRKKLSTLAHQDWDRQNSSCWNLPKKNIECLAILRSWPFLGWWNRELLKGCEGDLQCLGIKKVGHGGWITWCRWISGIILFWLQSHIANLICVYDTWTIHVFRLQAMGRNTSFWNEEKNPWDFSQQSFLNLFLLPKDGRMDNFPSFQGENSPKYLSNQQLPFCNSAIVTFLGWWVHVTSNWGNKKVMAWITWLFSFTTTSQPFQLTPQTLQMPPAHPCLCGRFSATCAISWYPLALVGLLGDGDCQVGGPGSPGKPIAFPMTDPWDER